MTTSCTLTVFVSGIMRVTAEGLKQGWICILVEVKDGKFFLVYLTLHTYSSVSRIFRAARSRWTNSFRDRYSIPSAI